MVVRWSRDSGYFRKGKEGDKGLLTDAVIWRDSDEALYTCAVLLIIPLYYLVKVRRLVLTVLLQLACILTV